MVHGYRADKRQFPVGDFGCRLVVDHTDETVPLNFTNLRPLTIEQLRDEFQMDENGVITNKNEDGFAGNPLYFFQVNVEKTEARCRCR